MAQSNDGFSDHEILIEIRGDLKEHIKDSRDYTEEVQDDLSARPTRIEVIGWFTGLGVVVGLVAAFA